MFLTDDEIADLTRRTQHPAQARVLRAMGIEHRQRPDGSLAVLRAHVVQLLGCGGEDKMPAPDEPDWEAVNA